MDKILYARTVVPPKFLKLIVSNSEKIRQVEKENRLLPVECHQNNLWKLTV